MNHVSKIMNKTMKKYIKTEVTKKLLLENKQ